LLSQDLPLLPFLFLQ